MEFNFIEEDEDDETLDLSDLKKDKAKSEARGVLDSKRLGVHKQPRQSAKDKGGDSSFEFTGDIPAPKSITDKDVQAKAKKGRKRSLKTMGYDNKRAQGLSPYCAHDHHLPNVCEGMQNEHQISCTCPCHAERGYVRQEPEYVPGSDDEEIILLLN